MRLVRLGWRRVLTATLRGVFAVVGDCFTGLFCESIRWQLNRGKAWLGELGSRRRRHHGQVVAARSAGGGEKRRCAAGGLELAPGARARKDGRGTAHCRGRCRRCSRSRHPPGPPLHPPGRPFRRIYPPSFLFCFTSGWSPLQLALSFLPPPSPAVPPPPLRRHVKHVKQHPLSFR